VIGKSEITFLQGLSAGERRDSLTAFIAHHPVAVVVTRNLDIPTELVECCKRERVPLLTTEEGTSAFVAALIAYLNIQLAPCITTHGVFVEVYGEGILLTGDSGVGKSETAIELVKRGHRLIADDAVEISRVSAKTLVGSAPENIRHFIELRGVGIVNARRIFGMGAVKTTERIDMVIRIEPWDSEKTYDRMGLDNDYADILGIKVPQLTIPVKPGRNLAVIIEVAAMNYRQKKMGYNAAYELMQNLGMTDDLPTDASATDDWYKF
jgi:HPr kinase/phosphorylase